jgi:predicted membrane protein
METQNTPVEQSGRRGRGKSNRPLGGLILVIIGTVFLVDRMDLDVPRWIFSWEMLLIGIGLYIGARRSFQPGGWIVPIILGVAFLVQEEFLGHDARHFFWPVFLIGIGLYMILRPKRNHWDRGFVQENSSDDFIDSSVVFGGVKKKIITKNFKGGRIENMFGGTDIDMMQADFKGTAVFEFNVAFGGVKLVVPPHWNIKNEVTVILGGIDDRRPSTGSDDPDKVLILRGTVMFGGIDIKSY